jgi:ketosteroid isomerase-like protein
MTTPYHDLIKHAYAAFNARDIEAVLLALHPEVQWANGWEGGYVYGHDQVRKYWTRQWTELDPYVEPVGFVQRGDGRIEVEVRQTVKDLKGNVLFDGPVKHIYTIRNGQISRMDIEKL